MNIKKTFQDSERAVSPVIGVILMVAITVILAAVIGTFVLELGGDLGQNANAGVSVDKTNSSATVTLVDKGNVDQVNITNGTSPPAANLTNVGDTETVDFNSSDDIQVIGVLPDGTETVIRTIERP